MLSITTTASIGISVVHPNIPRMGTHGDNRRQWATGNGQRAQGIRNAKLKMCKNAGLVEHRETQRSGVSVAWAF
jgi:hypothetical protein